MANGIWIVMLLSSLVFGFATENGQDTVNGIMDGANKSVELVISLAGIYIMWLGLMEIARKSGLANHISSLLSRPLTVVFSGIKKGSDAMAAICMNVSANFLGMGNAATPFGLKAMEELQKLNRGSDTVSNAMVMLIVLNSSSVQLIPATIIAMRAAAGSATPGDITIPVLVATTATTALSVITCKLMERRHG